MRLQWINYFNQLIIFARKDESMGELSKLPNIGKVVESQLNEVGINI